MSSQSINAKYLEKSLMVENQELGFRVRAIASHSYPQTVIYLAYSQQNQPGWVGRDFAISSLPDEQICGKHVVSALNQGTSLDILDYVQATFACEGINHATVEEVRKLSNVRCQDFRAIAHNIAVAASKEVSIDKVIYFKKEGNYNGYAQSQTGFMEDWSIADTLVSHFSRKVRQGAKPEFCRSLLPFDYRVNFVMSTSLRSLIRLFNLRLASNVEPEFTEFCNLLIETCKMWVPEIMEWYL